MRRRLKVIRDSLKDRVTESMNNARAETRGRGALKGVVRVQPRDGRYWRRYNRGDCSPKTMEGLSNDRQGEVEGY